MKDVFFTTLLITYNEKVLLQSNADDITLRCRWYLTYF